MILTWICQFCGWANDNNNGPCRKCGGQTEMRLVKGKWKEVTIKEPAGRQVKPHRSGGGHRVEPFDLPLPKPEEGK